MPKLVVTHEVDDIAQWLASTRRDEVLSDIGTNITTYVMPGGGNRVAVTMDVADMDAFDALMQSDAAAEAMKDDGVRGDTFALFVES
jgi:hypothetical protein